MTGNVVPIYLGDSQEKSSVAYEIHLRPTVVLYNSLPVPLYILTCESVDELMVPAGASLNLSSVKPGASFVIMKVTNRILWLKSVYNYYIVF